VNGGRNDVEFLQRYSAETCLHARSSGRPLRQNLSLMTGASRRVAGRMPPPERCHNSTAAVRGGEEAGTFEADEKHTSMEAGVRGTEVERAEDWELEGASKLGLRGAGRCGA
jgi:hypothetical protein